MTDENLKPMPDCKRCVGFGTIAYFGDDDVCCPECKGKGKTRAQEPTGEAVEAFKRMCALAGWDKPNVIYGDRDTVLKALQTPAAGNAIPSESVDVEALKRECSVIFNKKTHETCSSLIGMLSVIDHLAAQGLLSGKIPSGYALVIEAFSHAVDVADKLIERGYGTDIPDEWNEAVQSVQAARSAAPSTNKEETK